MNQPQTWHDDDAFWEMMAPFIFSDEGWAAAAIEVDQVIALLKLPPGAAVLDLGGAPGRHSLALARQGFHVTGVDRTSVYLDQARRQAEAEGLTVEFVQADMRDFRRLGAFDAALSLFTSFGYFETAEENRQVLANACASLREGGKLAIELMGKEVLARIFQARDWQEEHGSFLLQDRQVSDDWTHMENRWILVQDGTSHEFRVTHWIYSAAELAAMLRKSGFDSVDAYGGLEGSPYDLSARRLVVVGHK